MKRWIVFDAKNGKREREKEKKGVMRRRLMSRGRRLGKMWYDVVVE